LHVVLKNILVWKMMEFIEYVWIAEG